MTAADAERAATTPQAEAGRVAAEAAEVEARHFEAAAELFRALASPARLAILERLLHEPARVNDLVDSVGLSQPLVSQHLRVLREADLVQGHRVGREITYRIADDHVGHVIGDALAHVREDDPHP